MDINMMELDHINTKEEFTLAEQLANGKFKDPAYALKEILLQDPGTLSIPEVFSCITEFRRAMTKAGATKTERGLVWDWVFLTVTRQRFSN
jgi:hypothetical protein